MLIKRKPYLELLTEHEGEEEVGEAIELPLCAKNFHILHSVLATAYEVG